jgi:hypothetical protein
MEPTIWSWAALAALGAVHGLNPGMGWLFAVALAIQEGDGRVVWKALGPLAAGHALAIAAALGAWVILGDVVPGSLVQWTVALLLFGMGVRQVVRHRHPRYGGMRVGPWRLTVWSFLMASAHGAGLMALPVVLTGHGAHAEHATVSSNAVVAIAGSVAHGAGYVLVTALVASLFYYKIGVGRLQRLWVNVNLVWAAALIVTAVLTPLT